MNTPADVIAAARGWLGVPFRHQGRSRFGVDCIGLVLGIAEELALLPGILVAAPRDYRRLPPSHLLRERIAAVCPPAPAASAGILVLIRWPRLPYASHIALCTGPTLIHALSAVGRVCEAGYRAPWPQRTCGLYRLPGVTYE